VRLQALYQMAQAMALSLFQPSDLPLDYHRHFVGVLKCVEMFALNATVIV